MRGLIRLIIILLAIVQSVFFWKIKKREPKKILIAHDLLLGDTLLLAPLMKRIHEKYPEAQKFMLSKSLFVPLLKNKPYGFKALSFNPKSFLDIWGMFSLGPYDLTFVAGDNRYSWLARAIGSRWIVGIANDKPQWKNWMLDEVKSFVVCHLGASNPLKFWPAKSWQRLIQKLRHKGFEIFISVGPGEEYLIKEADPGNTCQHIPGTYSLSEMWSLINRAKLLISVDTGIAHLAKLSNTPIVTLFGPGSHVSHGAGNFWKFSHHADITKSDFHCRNQPVLFRRKIDWLKRCGRNISQCKTPGACMDIITPEQVMKVIGENTFL